MGTLVAHQTRLSSPSTQLADGEKAGPPRSSYPLETQCHRGSSYWRRPEAATAHFRRGPRGFLHLPRPRPRPPPFHPPPFHHGYLCVVWGDAGPPCPPIALIASPSPPRGRIQRRFTSQALGHQPGRFPTSYFRGRTPLSPPTGKRGRNLGFSLLFLGSDALRVHFFRGGSLSYPSDRGTGFYPTVLRSQRLSLSTATPKSGPRGLCLRPQRRRGLLERREEWRGQGPLLSPPQLVPLVPQSLAIQSSRYLGLCIHPLPDLFPSPGCSHGVAEGKRGSSSSSSCFGSSGRWRRRSGSRSTRRGEAATFNQFGCQG